MPPWVSGHNWPILSQSLQNADRAHLCCALIWNWCFLSSFLKTNDSAKLTLPRAHGQLFDFWDCTRVFVKHYHCPQLYCIQGHPTNNFGKISVRENLQSRTIPVETNQACALYTSREPIYTQKNNISPLPLFNVVFKGLKYCGVHIQTKTTLIRGEGEMKWLRNKRTSKKMTLIKVSVSTVLSEIVAYLRFS